mmetsp:Transcript_55241/g.135270  ORF Transcript_55241/g.135270 Transcript_55241/m.135270 type:complete len:235 (+) Transcript_55241:274-978(+)
MAAARARMSATESPPVGLAGAGAGAATCRAGSPTSARWRRGRPTLSWAGRTRQASTRASRPRAGARAGLSPPSPSTPTGPRGAAGRACRRRRGMVTARGLVRLTTQRLSARRATGGLGGSSIPPPSVCTLSRWGSSLCGRTRRRRSPTATSRRRSGRPPCRTGGARSGRRCRRGARSRSSSSSSPRQRRASRKCSPPRFRAPACRGTTTPCTPPATAPRPGRWCGSGSRGGSRP